jgi:hypothetical protein
LGAAVGFRVAFATGFGAVFKVGLLVFLGDEAGLAAAFAGGFGGPNGERGFAVAVVAGLTDFADFADFDAVFTAGFGVCARATPAVTPVTAIVAARATDKINVRFTVYSLLDPAGQYATAVGATDRTTHAILREHQGETDRTWTPLTHIIGQSVGIL